MQKSVRVGVLFSIVWFSQGLKRRNKIEKKNVEIENACLITAMNDAKLQYERRRREVAAIV